MDQEHSYTAHSTTISAAALAARIAALEAQLLAAQQANTRLIGRIVELEHERDKAMALIADYAKMLNRLLFGADGAASQMDSISSYPAPRAHDPGRLCDHCTLPLVSAHIVDEVVITDGTRRAHVHHVCMSAYPGWTVVATARGGRDA